MVATRDQIRDKKRDLTAPPVRRVNPVVRVPANAPRTEVFDYDVVVVSGQVVANLRDRRGAQLVFDGPSGMNARDVHQLAVRWLRRRGPDFAPSGVQARVTLQARGGGQLMERV